MSQNKEVLDSVAQYLPEGLDEDTLQKVSELVAVIIEQRVEERVGDLTTKVQSFIRGNIEKLKEQAIKELELQNETLEMESKIYPNTIGIKNIGSVYS